MAVIGLDLGGTKLSSAVFSETGEILFKNNVSLDKKEGSEVGRLIKLQLKELLSVTGEKITSVGACVPGISYQKTGRVWAPNIPGWDDYPLLSELKEAAGDDVNIKIDSDRACSILGEVWKGAASGYRNAIFIAVGTGIGAGILIDGKTLRGSFDIAGAIGWMALNHPYNQKYKQCGCFEYYASGEGLVRSAVEFISEQRDYDGPLIKDSLNTRDIFNAYNTADIVAVKTIDFAIELWGMAAANLVSLFNPEVIIWGGGVFGPAAVFIDQIFEEARKWAQPISINQVSMSASRLGGDAVLYGAGYLALNNK